jgi:hypothetical protein
MAMNNASAIAAGYAASGSSVVNVYPGRWEKIKAAPSH